MNCNKNNPCVGVYGNCLDVKITNACNGSCKFCIEKGGLNTENVSVDKLIESTNTLKNYKKVLILGGEPFLYPQLAEYIEGIKDKEEIYITTNGSKFTEELLHKIANKLTAINISIHHYDEEINSEILGTKVSFDNIIKSIKLLKSYGVGVRINTNLIKGGIDSKDKAYMMALFSKLMGADTIRFAELQNCPELYVGADGMFDNIHDNPYCDGCEQELNIIEGIEVKVRLTCGIVNPLKSTPETFQNKSKTKVMYPNANIFEGWIIPDDSCHGRAKSYSSGGCHGRTYISSGGCH